MYLNYYILSLLSFAFPKVIKKTLFFRQEIDLSVNYRFINSILIFLKKHISTQFSVLNELTAIDNLGSKSRFIIIYKLLSLKFNSRITLGSFLKKPEVISINNLFDSSPWLEREA